MAYHSSRDDKQNVFEISISCDAEATYDPDDVHVYAVSRSYEACLTELPASQLTCTTPSATPLEGDEKLPNVMGLQVLSVQEPSLEQDARNAVHHKCDTSSPGSIVMPVLRPDVQILADDHVELYVEKCVEDSAG